MSVVGGNMDKVEINSYEDLFNVLDVMNEIAIKENKKNDRFFYYTEILSCKQNKNDI